MRRLKVCFVFPRLRYISGDPPLGIGYLAAYLHEKMDIEATIIDTTFTRRLESVYSDISKIKPDILGIYSDSLMAKDAITIAEWAQKNRFFIVFGGPQVTVRPELFIPYADVLVRGEGELIVSEIVKSYGSKDLLHIPGIWWNKEGEVIKNAPNQNFVDLDDIPFPKREHFTMQKYVYHWNYLDSVDIKKRGTTMIVSRSCPFSCTYCQPTLREMFGKRVRFHSPDNVVEQMEALKVAYSIEGIYFHDDTFTVDESWITRFCELLKEKKTGIIWGCNSRVDTVGEKKLEMMYDAGLRVIHFGIESGSQRILDNIYNKKIKIEQAKDAIEKARKIGIHTMGFFMIGAPTETEDEIHKTILLAKSLKLEEASFSLTTPFVGTYLYEMVSHTNKYNLPSDNSMVDYYSTYSLHGGISPRRIKFLQFKAHLFFYLHPFRFYYIIKHIFSLRGLRKFLNKVRRSLR